MAFLEFLSALSAIEGVYLQRLENDTILYSFYRQSIPWGISWICWARIQKIGEDPIFTIDTMNPLNCQGMLKPSVCLHWASGQLFWHLLMYLGAADHYPSPIKLTNSRLGTGSLSIRWGIRTTQLIWRSHYFLMIDLTRIRVALSSKTLSHFCYGLDLLYFLDMVFFISIISCSMCE